MPEFKYMKFNPPHPNLARQLQIVASILDTRPEPARAKKLDQMARAPQINLEELDALKEEIFKLPFEYPKSKYIYEPFPKHNLETLMQYFKDDFYKSNAVIIWKTPAHITPNRDFLNRYHIQVAACWLFDFQKYISCKDSKILNELYLSATPLKYGFEIVLQINPDLLKKFKNSERDKVARWIDGNQIPSMQDLFATINKDVLTEKYVYCCEILFIAAVLQKAEKMAASYCHIQDVFSELIKNPEYTISNRTPEAIDQYKKIGTQFMEVQKKLRSQAEQGNFDFKQILDDFNTFCNENGKDSFISEWTRPMAAAIANVYAGDFKTALEIYKEVLPNLFFTFNLEETAFYAGENKIHTLYQPALAVGAICRNRPFLKLIRSYCVIFGLYGKKFEAPKSSYNQTYPPVNKDSKNKNTDVEDWEGMAWADYFFMYFPENTVKNSKDLEKFKTGINSFLYMDEKKLPKMPKKPYNKKVIVSYKQFPQLAYFTTAGNVEAVRELIEAGVDVNEMTSSNDSAILLAIHKMNPTDTPYEPELGMELFQIIKKIHHNPTTLNTQTDKKKLTCLGLAVLSGKPDVVEDILNMGADVDTIHSSARETPLFTVTRLLSQNLLPLNYFETTWNPETVDSIRRKIDNFRGLSNDQIIKSWNSDRNLLNRSRLNYRQFLIKQQFDANVKAADLYQIAEILLKNKANPNMPLEILGIKGYTPLMLAAESDNIRLFKMMVEHNGDPNQTAYFSNALEGSCWELAVKRNSKHVLKYLEDNRDKFN